MTAEVPGSLRVSVWHSEASCTVLPASVILAAPTEVRGRYDGSGYWLPPAEGPMVRFSFSWLAMPGGEFLAALGLARDLAGHLAAMTGAWTSAVAHTVLLPVVDTSYMFEATPGPRERMKVPESPAMAALEQAGMGWLGPFAQSQGFADAAAVAELARGEAIPGG